MDCLTIFHPLQQIPYPRLVPLLFIPAIIEAYRRLGIPAALHRIASAWLYCLINFACCCEVFE